MTRSYTPGFAKGILDPAWFSKHGTEEQLLGVREALNVTLEEDGALRRRPGTKVFDAAPAASSGNPPGRMIPYTANDTDYMIYLRDDPSQANKQTIHVYQKPRNVGAQWSTIPVNWRGTGIIVGVDDFSPYIDNSNLASTTLEGHPYTSQQPSEVRYTQYDDKLFLFHDEHPTIMIQWGPDNIWTFDPYALERDPPEVWTNRLGMTWTITPPGAGIFYDLDTNIDMFERGMGSKQIDTLGLFGPAATMYDGATNIYTGSLFRLGNEAMVDTPTQQPQQSFGALWTVVDVQSPTHAIITPINFQLGANGSGNDTNGPEYLNTTDWAGPWNRTTETVPAVTLSVGIASQESTAITATGGLILEEHIGCMLVSPTLATVFLVLEADAIAATARLINYGKNAAAASTGLMTVYKPVGTIVIQQGRTHSMTSTIRGPQSIPVGHHVAQHDIGWLAEGTGAATAAGAVGGAVFAGDGTCRWNAVTDINPGGEVRVVEYGGFWQRRPAHLGPFSEWGLGPSGAANNKGTGYATTGCVHQRRLITSGYKRAASAVVCSQTNQPLKNNALHQAGRADGPLNIIAGFDEGDVVQWVLSGDYLMIGTLRGEWILDGNPISSTSLGLERVGDNGSAPIDPVRIGSRVLWVAPNRHELYEAVFEERNRSIVTRSLMWQAHRTLLPGFADEDITQLRVMTNDVTRIYALTTYGKVLVLTSQETKGVLGWTRWAIGNGDDGGIDRVLDLMPLQTQEVERQRNTLMLLTRRSTVGGAGAVSVFEFMHEDFFELNQIYGEFQQSGTALTATGCNLLAPILLDRNWGMTYLMTGEAGSEYRWGGTFLDATGVVDYSSLGLLASPISVRFYIVPTVEVDLPVPPFGNERGPNQGQQISVRSASLFVDQSRGGTVGGRQITSLVVGQVPSQETDWVQVPGGLTGVRSRFPVISVVQDIPYNFRIAAAAFDSGSET